MLFLRKVRPAVGDVPQDVETARHSSESGASYPSLCSGSQVRAENTPRCCRKLLPVAERRSARLLRVAAMSREPGARFLFSCIVSGALVQALRGGKSPWSAAPVPRV
jgi:hypothetical protein